MSKLLNKLTPTVNDLAKKYKVSVVEIKKQLLHGIKVEKEHTNNSKIAREIALDHLGEKLDYYKKLAKIDEETGIGGVRGLGYNSGDPAGTDFVQQYINTNAMSYKDENGSKLDYIKRQHADLHNERLGFNFFDPTKIKSFSNFINEGISAGPERDVMGYEIGDYGGARIPPRPLDVKEGAKIDKAKKIAMAGMTAANMYTMADVAGRASEGGHGSPKGDIVRAASALPGAAGWGATAIHYGKKGYDLAKDALKKKKTSMEEEQIKEDLRKWFREKWVRYDTKGNIKGPCARDEGEGKPKCRPLASARAMSKDERAKSARRKRREDPVADRPGKGGKPIMVKTNEETLLEKNVPTNPALWARAKAQAKAKFDVYPSAYANGWASKWYKSNGGGWKSAANESVDEACWSGYQAKGMKKKGGKMVPNCVPVNETGQVMSRYTERPTYEQEQLPKVGGIERGIYEKETDASDETNMAKSQLKALGAKSKNLVSNLKGSKNLPAWVQSKIAVAKDGITAVDDYMTHSDRKLDEVSAERVGKVHLRYLEQNKPVPPLVSRAVIKKWLESKVGKVPGKEKKQVKEEETKKDVKLMGNQKPDAFGYGAKGLTKTIHEETTMNTKDLINEAIGNIMEDNLAEMKDNLMAALQEKAVQKLEERKKEIASNYFGQD